MIPTSMQAWIDQIEAHPNINAGPEIRCFEAVGATLARYKKEAGQRDIRGRIAQLRQQGLTMRQIAAKLNDSGPPPWRGGQWHHQSVALIVRQMRTENQIQD